MFYIQGCGIPGAVLGVGVFVERGFSGLSGLSGLPSFAPGAQVGSAIFYTRGTGGSKPVTVASRPGLHIRGWIRSSVRSSAQRQRRLLPRKGAASGGLARERGVPKMDSRSLAVVRSRYLTIRGRAWGMRRMIHDDSFEMPCACRRWRVRWVRRERRRRVILNVTSVS